MKYHTGSTVKVRLYSGQIVTANITDIVSRSAGRKIHIAYDNATVVNPAQIIEVAEAPPVVEMRVPDAAPIAAHGVAPAAAVRKRPTSQVVREIAEDYLNRRERRRNARCLARKQLSLADQAGGQDSREESAAAVVTPRY